MLSLSTGGALGGPEEEFWDPPEQKYALHHHTQHPRVTEFTCPGREIGYEPMSSFSPWGGLGESLGRHV